MIYKRDYYVSVGDDHVVITKNPNPHLTTLEDLKDLNKRYLYREGQKILTPLASKPLRRLLELIASNVATNG